MRVLIPLVLVLRREDDSNWPEPDRVGRQELEVVLGNEHISFTVTSPSSASSASSATSAA